MGSQTLPPKVLQSEPRIDPSYQQFERAGKVWNQAEIKVPSQTNRKASAAPSPVPGSDSSCGIWLGNFGFLKKVCVP